MKSKYHISVILFLLCLFSKNITLCAQDINVVFVKKAYNAYNISCYGAHDGSIEAIINRGTPPYSFVWSGSNNFVSYSRYITGLGVGTYVIDVTDAANNTYRASTDIEEPKALELNLNPTVLDGQVNISCQGCNNGKINIDNGGGAPPYNYHWSNNSTAESITQLGAGTYSLTLTDINGCTISKSTTLIEPSPLHVISITSPVRHGYNLFCYHDESGIIELTVTGGVSPYVFIDESGRKYSNSPATIQMKGFSEGNHEISISDKNDVTIYANITLTEPPHLIVNTTPVIYTPGNLNLSCYDCANGSITANVSGGTSPYIYAWEDGQSTQTISGLTARAYKVTITDANNCIAEIAINLYRPDREDWSMTGNAGTNPATQFVGTKDSKDLVIKTDNVERLRIMGNGDLKLIGLAGSGLSILSTDNSGIISKSNLIQYAPPADGHPSILSLNQPPVLPINLPNSCNMPENYPTNFQVNGMFQSYGSSATGGEVDLLAMGFDGQNGIIDMQGVNSGPIQPRLLLNYYCGADVFVGNSTSGDLTASHNLLSDHNLYVNEKIGIGTTTPHEGLQIGNKFTLRGDLTNSFVGHNYFYKDFGAGSFGDARINTGVSSRMVFDGDGNIILQTADNGGAGSPINSWNTGLKIMNNGIVGIGIVDPAKLQNTDYKLNVNGGIRAILVKVYEVNSWADYVFEKDHKLINLYQLEEFINSNKHLPGIPSAQEVKEQGVDLLEMDAKLLAKVEELSLYIISLQKEMDELKKQIVK